ncbi:MAG: FAD-binding protein [Henriciella sp.]|nr:FAD-binding protein [Henriciella sp.]
MFRNRGRTLFRGMGRSYGDVALNADGDLCQTIMADNILAFDPSAGRMRAESGATLGALNAVTIPHGWILPVNPGTKFVTLGGAVANVMCMAKIITKPAHSAPMCGRCNLSALMGNR